MAITAKFQADFSDFHEGVQKADQDLKQFEQAAQDAGTAIGLAFGAAAVAAITNIWNRALDAADAIEKMADQTGLSTTEVQKLDYVSSQTSSSITSLVSAIQNLQLRIGDDNSGAAGAMARLGVNTEEFNKLNTYDQFVALASAIRDIKDPTEQASTAAAIFGKNWKEILPAIKSDMRALGDEAPIMADAAVKSLDRIGDAMKRAKLEATSWGGSVVLAIEGAGYALGDYLSKFDPSHFGAKNSQILAALVDANDPTGLLRALDKVKEPAVQVGDAFKGIALGARQARDAEEYLNSTAKESIKVHEAQAKAAKAMAEATRKALDETIKGMAEFESEGVKAARSVAIGPLTVLRDLGVAMGDIQLASKPTTSFLALIPDLSGQAAAHMQKLTEETASFSSALTNLFAGKFSKGFSDLGSTIKASLDPVKILSGAAGNLLSGGISSLLNLGVSAIGGLFGKLFGNPEKEINPIREAFVQAAGGLDTLNQKAAAAGVTLDAMLNAKNPEQYTKAINDLNAALGLSDQAMKAADDTVQKFGLTVDQLGPKFKQQKLDEQAASLVNDYRLLDAVVADHATTLDKLAPSVNAYIATILKAGGTIPQELKDPIEQMRKLGLLTDDSGKAFTDAQLDGLTFATTLDAKFTTLLQGIQKLVDALNKQLGPAIDNLPSEHTVHIGYQVDAPPNADFGGDRGIIAAANGFEGMVTRPTLFLAGEAGAEHVSIGSGGGGGVREAIEALHQDIKQFPRMIRDAMILAT